MIGLGDYRFPPTRMTSRVCLACVPRRHKGRHRLDSSSQDRPVSPSGITYKKPLSVDPDLLYYINLPIATPNPKHNKPTCRSTSLPRSGPPLPRVSSHTDMDPSSSTMDSSRTGRLTSVSLPSTASVDREWPVSYPIPHIIPVPVVILHSTNSSCPRLGAPPSPKPFLFPHNADSLPMS